MAEEKKTEAPKNEASATDTPMPTSWDAVSKITLADIGCAGEAAGALPNGGDRILIARIVGRATGYKVKEDKRNNTFHTSLTGDFRAINWQKGTKAFGQGFTSGVAFLPAGLHEQVLSVIEEAEAEGKKATVEFGYDVYAVKKDRGTGAKHGYQAKPLTAPVVDDPMTKLLGGLPPPVVPQIEAPAPATA
jgi:hypothetical protein